MYVTSVESVLIGQGLLRDTPEYTLERSLLRVTIVVKSLANQRISKDIQGDIQERSPIAVNGVVDVLGSLGNF